jgi:hypothetical protein
MKIFDHTNPRHMEILREEYAYVKDIVEEFNTTYSADRLWGTMTPDERKSALYTAKAPNPEEYLSVRWDDIPADLQDLIDLSDYERATANQTGRSLYRGTKYAMTQDPNANRFVMTFLKNLDKAAIEDLTVAEMSNLNVKLWKFVKRNEPKINVDPNKTNLTADDYKAWQGRGGWQGD